MESKKHSATNELQQALEATVDAYSHWCTATVSSNSAAQPATVTGSRTARPATPQPVHGATEAELDALLGQGALRVSEANAQHATVGDPWDSTDGDPWDLTDADLLRAAMMLEQQSTVQCPQCKLVSVQRKTAAHSVTCKCPAVPMQPKHIEAVRNHLELATQELQQLSNFVAARSALQSIEAAKQIVARLLAHGNASKAVSHGNAYGRSHFAAAPAAKRQKTD
jgi:hypothetical protein